MIPTASCCGLRDRVQEKGKGETKRTLVFRDQSRGITSHVAGGGDVGIGSVSDVGMGACTCYARLEKYMHMFHHQSQMRKE